MAFRPIPRATLCAALALSAAALAGCASPGHAAGGEVQLVVRDGSLRELGAVCSGARPYLGFHKGAELALIDVDGRESYHAVLGDGEAVKVDDIDYGTAPRIPTFCRFVLDAATLESGTYSVSIDGDVVAEHVVDGPATMIFVPALASVDPSSEGAE
ncbi:hypothetical protein PX701_06840 [Agromyces sp. H3Y2-19a]|uniref:hypothetical protein n=1 Tax=Agromyces chromiiresistens TaxID=3030835 RepID=UPI0023B9F792|nr:hypothetical protein [Agromyces chromiiresistens]MDF0513331.1 hypothetical protein [Agromyces chromiiresistens]